MLNERKEAIRIARSYKSELEKVSISDKDIEYLHSAVSKVLEIVKSNELSKIGKIDDEEIKKVAIYKANLQMESYEQIKGLISIDTLKAMQLLGFNYKDAIGLPLTTMLKNFILSKIVNLDDNFMVKVLTPQMVEILKNKTAYDNFRQLVKENP